jgi:hypothetical protein
LIYARPPTPCAALLLRSHHTLSYTHTFATTRGFFHPMAAMEILTLLNTSATTSGKSTSREASPSSSHEDLATPPSTTVPTPSPEPSWTRPQVADRHNEHSQSWDAEDTSSSSHADSGFGWNANFSFPFKGESLDYARLEMDPSGSGTSRDSPRRPHRINTDSSSYRPQEPS